MRGELIISLSLSPLTTLCSLSPPLSPSILVFNPGRCLLLWRDSAHGCGWERDICQEPIYAQVSECRMVSRLASRGPERNRGAALDANPGVLASGPSRASIVQSYRRAHHRGRSEPPGRCTIGFSTRPLRLRCHSSIRRRRCGFLRNLQIALDQF